MKPNRLPLITLWTTYFLSHVGNILASLAIPWFVLQTTGSAAQTGVTVFFSMIPTILGLTFGGTLVDRLGYKTASILADVASGLSLVLIPLLYQTVGLPFPLLLLLVFMGALLDAPGGSARVSMLPELAELAQISLDRMNAIDGLIGTSVSMIGAPLAGVLIALLGPINLLWFDAATFGISAVAIWLFIPSSLVGGPEADETNMQPRSLWNDFIDGVRFVRGETLILLLIMAMMVMYTVDGAVFSVIMPVLMYNSHGQEIGAIYQGWLIGAMGLGAVVGSAIYSAYTTHLPRRAVFLSCLILAPIYLFAILATSALWPLLLAFTVKGVILAPFNPILQSVMFERIPKNMRARVLGLVKAGTQVFTPVGILISGFLIEAFDLSVVLLLLLSLYITMAISFTLSPSNQLIRRTPEQLTQNV